MLALAPIFPRTKTPPSFPAYFRYTLDLNLTDEQVNHPLMREAEGIVSGACFIANARTRAGADYATSHLPPQFDPTSRCTRRAHTDHVGLVNDLFSYAKERMTNSDDTNIIRILQDHDGMTYEQAMDVVKRKIRQKEQDFIPAGLAVLQHPELGQDPEVHRWIASLPYCMGGNLAWSQEVRLFPFGVFPSTCHHRELTRIALSCRRAAATTSATLRACPSPQWSTYSSRRRRMSSWTTQ